MLQEQTRQKVPLDWAMTQNNLGIALSRLGEREERDEAAEGGGGRVPRGAPRVHLGEGAAEVGGDAETTSVSRF